MNMINNGFQDCFTNDSFPKRFSTNSKIKFFLVNKKKINKSFKGSFLNLKEAPVPDNIKCKKNKIKKILILIQGKICHLPPESCSLDIFYLL